MPFLTITETRQRHTERLSKLDFETQLTLRDSFKDQMPCWVKDGREIIDELNDLVEEF